MKKRLYRSEQPISKKTTIFSRYNLLVRLIALGLVLLFVSTALTSVMIFSKSYDSLQETTVSAMESIGRTIHDTLNEYMDIFQEIALTCIATPYTYEPYMLAAIETEPSNFGLLYAQELLRGYHLSMPMVSDISLFYNASQKVLFTSRDITTSNTGTQAGYAPYSVYARLSIPHLSQEAFFETLSSLEKPVFYTNDTLLERGEMMYLVPLSIKRGVESRRVLMISITADSFKKAIEGTLANNYAVESISWMDTCIYHQSADEFSHRYTYSDPHSFSVTLAMPDSLYQSIFGNYSSSVVRLAIMSAILCSGAIGLYIAFSYAPINKIVKQTGANVTVDELSAVQNYINSKEQNEIELRAELDGEREISRLKELEMMLLGLSVNDSFSSLLCSTSPYYYAAVSPLTAIPAVNDSISRLQQAGNVIAFEQFRSGYLVMIVGADNDHAQETIREAILAAIGGSIHLGIGGASTNAGQLHCSYLDAIISLNQHGSTTATELFPSVFTQQDFDAFSAHVAANDAAAVQTASMLFDRLDALENSVLLYWYNNVHLVEVFCSILSQYGYRINASSLLLNSSQRGVAQIRTAFLSMLEQLLSEGPQEETTLEKELKDNIIQYIHDNLSNEVLCINDISDTFNLSSVTVSKLIREKTGMYFKRYLTQARLEMAKDLLASGKGSVQDIAQQCGFSSASYFIRVFKNETGATPLQYRTSAQSSAD